MTFLHGPAVPMRCCIRCSCWRGADRNDGWCRHRQVGRGIGVSSRWPKRQGKMIKRMTGVWAITREDEWATMTVTIRALNHRYLDLQLRIPQALAAIEPAVRTLVGRSVSRGRIELVLSLQLRQTPAVEVEFNESFGNALSAAIDRARQRGLVDGA